MTSVKSGTTNNSNFLNPFKGPPYKKQLSSSSNPTKKHDKGKNPFAPPGDSLSSKTKEKISLRDS